MLAWKKPATPRWPPSHRQPARERGGVGSPHRRAGRPLRRLAVPPHRPVLRRTMRLMETVSLALVGIGAIEPSRLLGASGNVFSSEELEVLRAHGAVGDICLRFFDRQDKPVVTPLNGRVIGMELAQLRRASCVVGVAGDRRDSRRALGLPDQRPDHRSQHRPEAGRRRPRQRNREHRRRRRGKEDQRHLGTAQNNFSPTDVAQSLTLPRPDSSGRVLEHARQASR